jgi:hypothetical protein
MRAKASRLALMGKTDVRSISGLKFAREGVATERNSDSVCRRSGELRRNIHEKRIQVIEVIRDPCDSLCPPAIHSAILLFAEQVWQLRDLARYAPSFIESQRVGESSIAHIGP